MYFSLIPRWGGRPDTYSVRWPTGSFRGGSLTQGIWHPGLLLCPFPEEDSTQQILHSPSKKVLLISLTHCRTLASEIIFAWKVGPKLPNPCRQKWALNLRNSERPPNPEKCQSSSKVTKKKVISKSDPKSRITKRSEKVTFEFRFWVQKSVLS